MNHQVIARPNSNAVFSALGVYLDVMRPFVVQKMPVFRGTADTRALLRDSMPIEMRSEFDKRMVQYEGDESLTIDVTHIPHIVRKNWQYGFSREFNGQRVYITKMEALAKSRNLVCHPSAEDVSTNQAESVFHCVEKITAQIDREDACEQVSWIRQRLKDGCCSDCPEAHMQIDSAGQEDVEREMLRMQAELVALSDELSAIRATPRRSRGSAFASRLGRIVPRVSFRFSVAFGDDPVSVSEDASEAMAQAAEASVSESVATDRVDNEVSERTSSSNGHSPGAVSQALVKSARARKR